MHRLARAPIILTCEDFVPLGWNISQNPWDAEPHCCPGCHYEWEDRITPCDRLLPVPGFQPSRWSRTEARVCCSLRRWLDAEGHLGEQFLPKQGAVTFRGETHDVSDMRVYLDTRTIDRDVLARLVRAARKKGRGA